MPPESNVESTLIWYKGSDPKNYKYWTEEIDKFLEGEYLFNYYLIIAIIYIWKV